MSDGKTEEQVLALCEQAFVFIAQELDDEEIDFTNGGSITDPLEVLTASFVEFERRMLERIPEEYHELVRQRMTAIQDDVRRGTTNPTDEEPSEFDPVFEAFIARYPELDPKHFGLEGEHSDNFYGISEIIGMLFRRAARREHGVAELSTEGHLIFDGEIVLPFEETVAYLARTRGGYARTDDEIDTKPLFIRWLFKALHSHPTLMGRWIVEATENNRLVLTLIPYSDRKGNGTYDHWNLS